MTDFPAAHSMDTRWFAVDANGNVGLFDSGEDGAVPNAAGTLGGAAEPTFDAALFYATIAARRIANGWKPANELAGMDKPARVLVVANAAATFEADVLATTPSWIALSRGPVKRAELERLDGATVIGLHTLYDLIEDEGDVFAFARDHGDDPGLYQRERSPEKPLRVDELPAAARDAIGAVRVPVAFDAVATVHLADHMRDDEASMWGQNWTLRGFGDGDGPAHVPEARQVRASSPRAQLVVAIMVIVLVTLWLTRC